MAISKETCFIYITSTKRGAQEAIAALAVTSSKRRQLFTRLAAAASASYRGYRLRHLDLNQADEHHVKIIRDFLYSLEGSNACDVISGWCSSTSVRSTFLLYQILETLIPYQKNKDTVFLVDPACFKGVQLSAQLRKAGISARVETESVEDSIGLQTCRLLTDLVLQHPFESLRADLAGLYAKNSRMHLLDGDSLYLERSVPPDALELYLKLSVFGPGVIDEWIKKKVRVQELDKYIQLQEAGMPAEELSRISLSKLSRSFDDLYRSLTKKERAVDLTCSQSLILQEWNRLDPGLSSQSKAKQVQKTRTRKKKKAAKPQEEASSALRERVVNALCSKDVLQTLPSGRLDLYLRQEGQSLCVLASLENRLLLQTMKEGNAKSEEGKKRPEELPSSDQMPGAASSDSKKQAGQPCPEELYQILTFDAGSFLNAADAFFDWLEKLNVKPALHIPEYLESLIRKKSLERNWRMISDHQSIVFPSAQGSLANLWPDLNPAVLPEALLEREGIVLADAGSQSDSPDDAGLQTPSQSDGIREAGAAEKQSEGMIQSKSGKTEKEPWFSDEIREALSEDHLRFLSEGDFSIAFTRRLAQAFAQGLDLAQVQEAYYGLNEPNRQVQLRRMSADVLYNMKTRKFLNGWLNRQVRAASELEDAQRSVQLQELFDVYDLIGRPGFSTTKRELIALHAQRGIPAAHLKKYVTPRMPLNQMETVLNSLAAEKPSVNDKPVFSVGKVVRIDLAAAIANALKQQDPDEADLDLWQKAYAAVSALEDQGKLHPYFS